MVELVNGWTLRERQEECHDKMIAAYLRGEDRFLVAAVCRFGKTITTLQSLRDISVKRGDASQAIIVVSTMSAIKKEWADAADAMGFDSSLMKAESVNDIDFVSLGESGKHVVFVTVQKLGNKSDKSNEIIRWFNRHEGFKALVYDECHLAGGTERTKDFVDRINYDFKVSLSGTPYRQYLREEYDFERDLGENITYLYSMTDERKDYESGKIRDYRPVKLRMMVLDYQKEIEASIDEEELHDKFTQRYGVSSKYFKKLFSEPSMNGKALEFFDKIAEFANLKGVKNGIFFVPIRKVGQDILKNFAKKVSDRFEICSLCEDYAEDSPVLTEEDYANFDSEAEKVNAFFDRPNPEGKIRIAITCNKCGTGTTFKNLDFVAFLKETDNAIQFIQQSQRVRTPKEGKEEAYALVFNQWSGLKAFADFAKASYTEPEKSDADKIKALCESGAISLELNMTEMPSYEDIIDFLSVYHPGDELFTDKDFSFDFAGDIDFSQFGESFKAIKDNLAKKHPDLRADPDFQNAATVDDLKRALKGAGHDKEAKSIEAVDLRAAFQEAYVGCVQSLVEIFGRSTVGALRDYDGYSDDLKVYVCSVVHIYEFDFWKRLNDEYVTYFAKIVNYLEKNRK